MPEGSAEEDEIVAVEGVKEDLLLLHAGLSRRLKQYEQVLNDFPADVLNEFRYAGRSTLRLFVILRKHANMEALEKSGDFAAYQNYYKQAEHAYRCGYHDLIDGLVYELTQYLDEMSAHLSKDAIIAMGDFRNEVLNDLEECNKLIADSRANLDQRDDLYEDIFNGWFERLLQHKKMLKHSVIPKVLEVQQRVEAERDALVQMRVEEERKALVRHNSNTRLALAGIGVTIVLSLIQIWMAAFP